MLYISPRQQLNNIYFHGISVKLVQQFYLIHEVNGINVDSNLSIHEGDNSHIFLIITNIFIRLFEKKFVLI